ncbi:peptide transporter family 1-like [Rhopalosiphum padi]|uniref:peptide transporter family 1-like n=1 Tax=Rhopalosiphum padi TaxID=40932 RepID=UPI00298E49F5|nr:peptide transporter family 1-like [Rhopalosiphum padi]
MENSLFNSPSAVLVPENVYMTSEKKHPYMIHIIIPSNEDGRIWLRIKNLTLESTSNNKITIFEESLPISQFQNKTILKIPSGLYTLTIHYMDKKQKPISMNVLKFETNSIYIYRNEYDNNLMNSKFKSNAVLQTRVLSKEWLLPQFVCMTFGETLFTMTGLSFSFSETPESMKTVSISMWYFCVALGNLTVIFINKFVTFEKKSNMFFMFAFIALLTIIVTNKLSNTYEKLYYKKETENENDRDNANLVMLLKKESYQLSF